MSCPKVVLTVFNVLLILLGLAPLVFGIIALTSEDILADLIDRVDLPVGTNEVSTIIDLQELIKTNAFILIIFGSIISSIGFLGFFGICCEIYCLAVMYLSLLILLLLAEIAIVILAYAFPSTFNEEGKSLMLSSLSKSQLRDYSDSSSLPVDDLMSMAWHSMQYGLKCCGVYNYNDFDTVSWQKRSPNALAPLTCCSHESTDFPPNSYSDMNINCVQGGSEIELYNLEGCFDTLLDKIKTTTVVIGILAGIGALQILLILLTCVVVKDIKDANVRVNDDYMY